MNDGGVNDGDARDLDPLLERVRAACQALDPLPPEVLAAARAALRWREPGAELAELSGDHGARSEALAGAVRGAEDGAEDGMEDGAGAAGGPRTLTFTARDVLIEIEVSGTGRVRDVVGRLAPPVPARVRVRHPALVPGRPETGADRAGQFTFAGLPRGLVSFAFLVPDGTSIVTSWVRL
ncbi:hypothetical protein GCM10023085_04480 [Actinomadura viridis]|uniref:Uncharacterized protein n=1 Tax=Actinomadura viridis TaxID=58110 RepID=A0A931GQ27_9ACTN|nr:hypothetical protein [Actinomadura viridis]MBG6091266.1 hypothetical protein [Actinomadura viridis]